MFNSHIGPIAIFKVPEAPVAIGEKQPYLLLGAIFGRKKRHKRAIFGRNSHINRHSPRPHPLTILRQGF